jgi:hypothetical protein
MPTEEQRDEDVAERHQLGERLVAVIGFRDDETGEKGAERKRRPGRRGAERGERADEDHRDEKQLAAPRLENLRQRARHDGPCRDDHPDHDERGLAERDQEPGCAALRLPGEERQHEHDRHHAQVLEDQDRRRQAAVRRVDLALVGHHLEHDGGAR